MISVTELCRKQNVTRKTLFLYDRIHLLEPTLREGRRHTKMYDEKAEKRLSEICRYRKMGFPLDVIGRMLDDASFDHIEAIRNQIARLNRQRDAVQEQIMLANGYLEELLEQEKGNG